MPLLLFLVSNENLRMYQLMPNTTRISDDRDQVKRRAQTLSGLHRIKPQQQGPDLRLLEANMRRSFGRLPILLIFPLGYAVLVTTLPHWVADSAAVLCAPLAGLTALALGAIALRDWSKWRSVASGDTYEEWELQGETLVYHRGTGVVIEIHRDEVERVYNYNKYLHVQSNHSQISIPHHMYGYSVMRDKLEQWYDISYMKPISLRPMREESLASALSTIFILLAIVNLLLIHTMPWALLAGLFVSVGLLMAMLAHKEAREVKRKRRAGSTWRNKRQRQFSRFDAVWLVITAVKLAVVASGIITVA